MSKCWNLDSTSRPTFSEAWKLIDDQLGNETDDSPYLPMEEGVIGPQFQELDEQILQCLQTKVVERSEQLPIVSSLSAVHIRYQ